MNIIYYVDDFYSQKGINYEIKNMAKYINENYDHKIIIIHMGLISDEQKKVFSLRGLSFYQLNKKLKFIIEENSIDLVHLRGLMSKSLLKIYLALLINKTPFVITLYSQLNAYNLNNKLFYEDPDVKSLKLNIKNRKSQVVTWFSPIFKKLFLAFFGRIIIGRASAIIAFSEFEKEQIESKVRIKDKIYIVHEALLDDFLLEKELENQENYNFYKSTRYEKKINIAYWGRVDFKLKGIDRIIEAVAISNNEDIVIHILGPNYADGIGSVKKLVKSLNLENQVIIHPDSVWMGNKAPLISSDYSILCSRWDGFPRSLRESVALNIPIIVSNETNFYDLCIETSCGFAYKHDRDLVEVFNKIKKTTKKYIEGCCKAKNAISEKKIADDLMEIYRAVTLNEKS